MAELETIVQQPTLDEAALLLPDQLWLLVDDARNSADIRTRKVQVSKIGSTTIINNPGGGTGEVQVDNLAALRALDSQPTSVWVKGHTTEGDGGQGVFRLLADSGGTASDVSIGGHDDNGWTIVQTTGGAVYGREWPVATPEHFGATGVTSEALAAAAGDQSAAMQRFVDFVLKPKTFNWRTWRPGEASPDGVVQDLLYRCNSTIKFIIDQVFPLQLGERPGSIVFRGAIWTPLALNQPGAYYWLGRNNGKSYLKVRTVKQKQVSGRAEWNDKPWPDLFRDPDAYVSWAATSEVYKDDCIKHVMGDGSTMLYAVTVSGTTGASAPTHTTGSVANGTATLQAMGTIRNTAGETVKDMLAKCRDSGHWIDRCWESYELYLESEGYTIGLDLTPRGASNSVGFMRVKVGQMMGCKFGFLNAAFVYDKAVADQPARLALTGLPIGYRVNQLNDATFDYIFNGPLGGEATNGNWSTATKNATPRWSNELYLESGLVYGYGGSGSSRYCDTDRSVYGFVQASWDGQPPPSHNTVDSLTVEFATQTGNAEMVQAVFDSGNESTVHCRNDQESLGTVALFLKHAESSLTPEPIRNKVVAARAGRWISDPTWSTDESCGRQNLIEQTPGRHDHTKTFEVCDLSNDAVFSGKNKVYFQRSSIWPLGTANPQNWATYQFSTSSFNYWQFHAAEKAHSFGIHAAPCVVVSLPDNHRGDAVIEVECMSVDFNAGFRVAITPFHPVTGVLGPNVTSRPRRPIATSSGSQSGNSGGEYYYLTTVDSKLTVQVFPEPWVKKLLVRVYATTGRMLGYRVRVLESPMASICSPAHSYRRVGEPFVDTIPERGIWRAPSRLLFADQTGGNKGCYLNKVFSETDYWAVSDAIADIGAPVNYQWGHDGAGTVKEYLSGVWNTIATGVSVVEPGDWTTF